LSGVTLTPNNVYPGIVGGGGDKSGSLLLSAFYTPYLFNCHPRWYVWL